MNWNEFAQAAPDLAQAGEERFERWGLILLGSVRKDGTPRVSPVEPLIVGGELMLGMMWQSKKALDLLRDPRCLVHSIITDRKGNEGEFKLRGRARHRRPRRPRGVRESALREDRLAAAGARAAPVRH